MHKEKKLIFTSVVISIGIHFLSLIAIHSQSLYHKSIEKTKSQETLALKEPELMLEKAFSFPFLSDEKKEMEEELPTKEEALFVLDPLANSPLTTPEITLATNELQENTKSSAPSIEMTTPDLSPPILPEIEGMLFLPQEELKPSLSYEPKNESLLFDSLSLPLVSLQDPYFPSWVSSLEKKDSLPFSFDAFLENKNFLPLFLDQNQSKKSSIPTLKELQTVSYSDDFEVEVLFIPEEKEYFFAITLMAHPDLEIPRLRQHFDFLIDRSNSIEKTRLQITKQAVVKAIESLSLDDSFNIFAFDSKIDKFSSSPQLPISSSIKQAKQFLESQQLGSFFSPANLYKPLISTLPSEKDKIHTAILLTDGESLRKKQNQREFGLNWSLENQGKVSLFSFSLSKDQNQEILKIATALNRGKSIDAPSERGMKRKLLKWMKLLSRPVAHDLQLSIFSDAEEELITFFPSDPSRLPHLYLDLPYVILGKAKDLKPFTLFVQGKTKEGWINIKKKISFDLAKEAPSQLKKDLALHESYDLYHRYLNDFDLSHFDEIRSLLTPFDLPVAFE